MRKVFLSAFLLLSPCVCQAALDIYGGDGSKPCVGVMKNGSAIPGATGFFYLYKDTNLKHWMWCDPLGNRLFMQSVENLGTGFYAGGTVTLATKYGAGTYDIYKNWTPRMQAIGFNTLGVGADLHMLPVSTSGAVDGGNPNKMPFIFSVRPVLYSTELGPAGTNAKPIFPLLPPAYNIFRGKFSDVFDAGFSAYVNALFNTAGGGFGADNTFTGPGTPATVDASPWYVGTMADDTDDFWGMKDIAVDIGWITGVAPIYVASIDTFQMTPTPQVYNDTTFHTKDQLRTVLTTKYGTVGALNTAWGSTYSSFGSSATTVTGETIGTGDGATTSFSHTFAHGVVDPYSIGISVGGTLQAGDCPWFNGVSTGFTCSGKPSGQGQVKAASGNINGGTVTYASGGAACGVAAAPCITATFSVAPGNGVVITATYQYGGWPKATAGGTGLMDEDGSSSWYPTCCGFANPPVGAIATDLHAFLKVVATQYYSVINTRLKAALPHHLLFGVNGIDVTKVSPDELSIEAQYTDLLTAGGCNPNFVGSQTACIAAYNTSGMPVFVEDFEMANPDSSVYSNPDPLGTCGTPPECFPTQPARGLQYLSNRNTEWNSFIGSDGYNFTIAEDWWQWTDDNIQKQNFGLVSENDNLYGTFPSCLSKQEDVAGSITDCFGFTTTAEPVLHGDAMQNGLICANQIWLGSTCAATFFPTVKQQGHLP